LNILYIMSSFNIYGGTPKKTLDLINNLKNHNSFLYVYYINHLECKKEFEENTVEILEGYHSNNLYKHVKSLLKFIDENNIQIVQTQFLMGELLGGLIKLFRPKVKIIVAFVGPFSNKGIKKIITGFIYKYVDTFVYISEYVKKEKSTAYPILKKKNSKIIYNGSSERIPLNSTINIKSISLVDVAALIDWKNATVLIEAMNILINEYKYKEIYLYFIGEGNHRKKIEEKIVQLKLENNVILKGKQKDVGTWLKKCDIFVHPAYAEGFGVATAEAMLAEKPIILSNAGAHPELIKNEESGLIVDPFDAKEWAFAINRLLKEKEFSKKLSYNAKIRAQELYSIDSYVSSYDNLYNNIMKDR